MVAGKSGSGKYYAMVTPAIEALLYGYDLIVIDPSKGASDFKPWGESRSIAFIGQGNYRQTEACVLWVEAELDRRVKLLAKTGCTHIDDLPEADRPKRILLVFDEFESYLKGIMKPTANPADDQEIAKLNRRINSRNASIRRTGGALSRIAIQGRTTGISILIGAHRLTSRDCDVFPGGRAFYKTVGKLVLGAESLADVVCMMNLSEAHRLQKDYEINDGKTIGRGIYESAEGMLSVVQTWWPGTSDDISDVLSGVQSAEKINFDEYLPPEVK
ncbi:hypothetical protein DF196_07070 [Bifidobacterium callitrichidarum]|uniref:FtsK domain-containing protein n=1 Tax=Bifidobacterium callitrichidarum TaxID=2052941 RepID=A0A2U2N9C6_9BIFI|nr:hypothetical protein DF196_07070 [Bifidobacterium callitrichidarum]